MMEGLGFRPYEAYKDSRVDWIGSIPSTWDVQRAKWLFKRMDRGVRPEDDIVTCFRDGEVTLRSNRRTEGFTTALKEIGYQGIRKGDLVIHAMDAFAGAIGVSDSDGKATPVYSACVPRQPDTVDPTFYAYYMRNLALSGFLVSLAKGIRERSTDFRFNDFAELEVPFPSLAEQRAIVAFLDEKCAKAEGAVKIKEDQIALLRERRQIIIQDAVTRGLNPAAPMKESGIDWIGQIPAHWENMPNKYLFRLKKDTVGKRSAEYDLLSLTLRGIVKRDMENPEGKFPAEFDTYQEVCPGDFVFCHFDVEETPRTVGLSEFFGMITGAYTVYSVAQGVDPRFLLHFYIFADTDKKMRSMYRGLRNTIPKDTFAAFKTPLPPIEEQRAIVGHIDDASQKIEDGIAIKERQIAALKEYKTSLINAAVTGKIKVI
jgi:type I restriction enzyme S subunit